MQLFICLLLWTQPKLISIYSIWMINFSLIRTSMLLAFFRLALSRPSTTIARDWLISSLCLCGIQNLNCFWPPFAIRTSRNTSIATRKSLDTTRCALISLSTVHDSIRLSSCPLALTRRRTIATRINRKMSGALVVALCTLVTRVETRLLRTRWPLESQNPILQCHLVMRMLTACADMLRWLNAFRFLITITNRISWRW
jgi:hypothetical protein